MSDIVERFERAVAANGYRTRDEITEQEYESAKLALLQLLSEAEKREREARAKALENLAVWIEGQRKDVPAYGWEFAAAIRELALQSEER